MAGSPSITMTPEQMKAWQAEQTQKAFPLYFAGGGTDPSAFVLIIGKHPSLIGDVGVAAIKMNRVQAFQFAMQILQGFNPAQGITKDVNKLLSASPASPGGTKS